MSLRNIGCIALLAGSTCFLPAQQSAEPEHSPGDGGPAGKAFLNFPESLAFDRAGNMYISERGGNRVRKIDARTGTIVTIAGTGEKGFAGDGGPATQAKFDEPTGLAVDREGNLFIGDTWNYRIRRVDAKTGVISTIAGQGKEATSGDGGTAKAAEISGPFGFAFDAAGNLHFTDTETHRIRRIDARTGTISTVAGNGKWGDEGDGGPATQASLARPHRLTFAPDGALLIGDSFNQKIRRVDPRSGVITTIAGTGFRGSAGDGGAATEASFCYFGDMLVDRSGGLLLSGVCDQRIRRVDLKTGIISAFAGTGRPDFAGDGDPKEKASFYTPTGMAYGPDGDLYVVDMRNHRVRKISSKNGTVTTVAGGPAPKHPAFNWAFRYDAKEFAAEADRPIAYPLPPESTVEVKRNLDYSGHPDRRRKMDVYLPANRTAGARLPAVLLIHGRGETDYAPKDWGGFTSRARAVAGAGMAAVMFSHTFGMRGFEAGEQDIRAAIEYVRANAAALGIDGERLCVAAFDGAQLLAPILAEKPTYLRCAAAFYPLMDTRMEDVFIFGRTKENAARYSLVAQLEAANQWPSMFIARAGKDQAPLNQTIDSFLTAALKKNFPVQVVNYAEGGHEFDRAASDPQVAGVIRQWLEFTKGQLSQK